MDPTTAVRSDDAELVRRARAERAAFGALYDRHFDRVYRYAYHRTRNHPDAEDVTAETFRRAIEAIDRFEPRGSGFGGWLFGIAANVLRERRRARRDGSLGDGPAGPGDEAEPVDGDSPAIDVLVQQEEASALWRAVEGLPTDLQRALVLRYAWDLPYGDIAERMGRSDLACKQLVYRALKTLRARVNRSNAVNRLERGNSSAGADVPFTPCPLSHQGRGVSVAGPSVNRGASALGRSRQPESPLPNVGEGTGGEGARDRATRVAAPRRRNAKRTKERTDEA